MTELPREAVARLREEVESDPPILPDGPTADPGRLYAFFSFDLVNSTAFKAAHPDEWPLVIKKFYEFIEDQLSTKRLPDARRWKYVGDEVLFYMRIRTRDDLRQLLEKTHNALTVTVSQLYERFPFTRTLLSVKGCVWCAHVHELPVGAYDGAADLESPRNIVVRSPVDGAYQFDFLGPDVDIGFRIGGFSSAGRLVVGADLAYLLYRDRADQEGVEDQLRVVDYQQLKGVWAGRHHPIIWHEEDWTTVRESFPYDAKFHDPIAQRVLDEHVDPLSSLPKVFRDLDDEERVVGLWEALGRADPEEAGDEEIAANPYLSSLEVHCVAVCVRSDGRVLVAQRNSDKRRFAGHWEFGCAQLQERETFVEALVRSYRSDFNAELDFGGDPTPVRTYDIGGEVPGLIVVATVANPDEVTAHKHQRVEWIEGTEEDRKHFSPAVPDFWLTFDMARRRWKDKPEQEGPAAVAAT